MLILGATTSVGPVVGLDEYAPGHQHFELGDGQYGIIRGELAGENYFIVDSTGTDLLVVYNRADGYDDPYFQGAVALIDYTGPVLIG
ncbi:hypothetical protein [Paracraurococcus ruber]|uniref:hypothetical protein n=1 Tax=Paracraurococcus ruber TaxID=77675 RepID=UPI0010580C76|nr:hypothetical protein [Paracraurococcus ruber]TDG18665.1 hypothetical protein E2C05_27965 [Paracraurococcus ruber]